MCVYISYIVYVYIYIACIACGVYKFFQYIYIHTYTAFFSEKGEVINQTANTPEGWGEGSNVF